MIGREKPFEALSSKEEEAFKLVSEILMWSNDRQILAWPGVGQLREEATRLFEMVSNMDAEYDDHYYKVYSEIERLKKIYERKKEYIENDIRECKTIRVAFDIERDNVEELVKSVEQNINGDISHIKFSYETKISPGVVIPGWGDWVEFDIWDCKKLGSRGFDLPTEGYSLQVSEMFANSTFDSPYMLAIRNGLEEQHGKSIDELAKLQFRMHDYGGSQADLDRHYQTLEELEGDLRLIIKIIRDNPRQLKRK